MGNSVLPDLPGRSWPIGKRPKFNTSVQTAVDLSELRTSFSATPVYEFGFSYDLLRDQLVQGDVTYDELRQLMGFYMARLGKWDSFLYTDPTDCSAAAQLFGTGDGSTTAFNLARTVGAFTERVANVNTISEITVANTPTSNYTVNSTGTVTFTSAPASNAALRWTGTYYFRCRMAADELEFTNFMSKLWDVRQLDFYGCLGTKI